MEQLPLLPRRFRSFIEPDTGQEVGIMGIGSNVNARCVSKVAHGDEEILESRSAADDQFPVVGVDGGQPP